MRRIMEAIGTVVLEILKWMLRIILGALKLVLGLAKLVLLLYHYDKDLRKLTLATDTPNKRLDGIVAESPLVYDAMKSVQIYLRMS